MTADGGPDGPALWPFTFGVAAVLAGVVLLVTGSRFGLLLITLSLF